MTAAMGYASAASDDLQAARISARTMAAVRSRGSRGSPAIGAESGLVSGVGTCDCNGVGKCME